MKEIRKQTVLVIERVYDSQEDCDADTEAMRSKGFYVSLDKADTYIYYRKFEKELEIIGSDL